MQATGIILALVLTLALSGISAAQEKAERPSGTAQENAEIAAKFAAQEAQRYEIVVGRDEKPLALEKQPLLRWSNPLRAEVYGSVLLWTRASRPEALASIYCYFDRAQVNAELVSLAQSPLVAKRSGKVRWSADAGVKYAPLAGPPAPAETREKRHLQMRSLARRFRGSIGDRDDDSKFEELRLMARPLYQYAVDDKSGHEGALFAFVTTNDPEILLLIESRLGESGREWHYAAARLNFCRLQLALDGKTVWDEPQLAPPWEKLRGPEGKYVILQWDSREEAGKGN